MIEHGARSLEEAAIATFESLAMLFASPELDAAQRASPATVGVRVGFRGRDVDGHLELRVAPGLVPSIAANMLGQSDTPTARVQQDALGELANVICGNALPAVLDSRELFELEAPVPLPDSRSPHTAAPVAVAEVWLESGRASVELYVDRIA
jgi:CheY-specific phosphatase CheX